MTREYSWLDVADMERDRRKNEWPDCPKCGKPWTKTCCEPNETEEPR